MALDMTRFIARFVDEAREHLTRLNDGLLALERNPADQETLHAVFRAAHTVKGAASMLKLQAISDTGHHLEEALSSLREGKIAYTGALADLLFRGADALSLQVEAAAAGAPLPTDEALCAALAAAATGPEGAGDAVSTEPAVSAEPDPREAPGVPADPGVNGAEPAAVRLKTLDTVRVAGQKLDELIKLMGEVISSHSRLRQRASDLRRLELAAPPEEGTAAVGSGLRLSRVAAELRDDVALQELLMTELHDRALGMRMLPLSEILDPLGRMVRDAARSVGKEVDCRIEGSAIELDRKILDKLGDPLTHLIRNAIDHGIEPAAKRLALGKPAAGTLWIGARHEAGSVLITVRDDGGGIALEKVREKALKKRLVDREGLAALPEAAVIDFIFHPGFSTSPIVTDISGRGVGMDVVKRTVVEELRGAITVESRPGEGTVFTLRLPLSLAMLRVVLVGAGSQPFGITANFIDDMVRAPEDHFITVLDRRALKLRNEFIPVVQLAELLALPKPASPPISGRDPLLIVVSHGGEKLALQVELLIDERDMVIKSLPEHLKGTRVVSGIVQTGRNELVSVLHVPALFAAARAASAPAAAGEAAVDTLDILVVDDSFNTREIEKSILEAHGYRVTLAEDGQDALDKARAGDFDLVITDVEMPRLDGFSLTSRLRELERYRDTPVIIVTSREKEEDKRRGIQVGADAYIVKGAFDQTNLLDTIRNLVG